MAFPLILFPTTLTGSLATILLPNLAALRAQKKYEKAQKTFSYTLRFCLFLGTVSAICFYLLADFLGSFLFDSNLCGLFIKTLAPLCPFLYMNTTLGGALHGLGKINEHFLIQVLSLGVRCLALPFLIPQLGITAYLYLLLFTSILQCSLSFIVVKKNITLS
jgi:stage V sporulation protein B